MKFLQKLGINLPPLPSTPPTHEPDRSTLLQLAFIIGIAVTMHFKIADIFIGLFAVAIFILKLGLLLRGRAAPNRILMMLLTIFSLLLIIALYGGWNGQRAGISFLVLLVTLKFLESRGLRDYFVVCLILYFLAASSFLFDSSIFSIIIVLSYTLAITSILFQLSNPTPMGRFAPYWASATLVLKAIPLAVLLFFFFPRIQGDFGFLPSQDQRSSQLSDSLVAGEMAASAFDNSLAFRVEFEGDVPPNQDRYWRAKVMSTEQNFTWEVSEPTAQDFQRSAILQNKLDLSQGQYKYRILHEKTTDLFLPYLDYVSGVERGRVLYDYSVIQPKASVSTIRYSGSSSLTPLALDQGVNRTRLLQSVSEPSARMQTLLAQWRNQAQSDAQIVQIVYQYLLDNPFAYSLTPPGLADNRPMEDFLFNTRTGYCEHYASAFTTLMRWLGVPSRVVAGYQGGRLNSSGQFLEVLYSDAHAWSEVWLNDRWVRVDPTAAVSPERIEFGMEALVELWESNALGSNAAGRALADFLNPSGTARMLRKLKDTWSNIGYQWNKWIVDYDFETQKELLDNLGFDNKNTAYTLITIMFVGVGTLILFYFWQLIPGRIKRSEAQTQYLKFVARFKKHDVQKNLSESPADFATKATQRFPEQKEEIEKITLEYQRIRYGKKDEDTHDSLARFKRLVKSFRVANSS